MKKVMSVKRQIGAEKCCMEPTNLSSNRCSLNSQVNNVDNLGRKAQFIEVRKLKQNLTIVFNIRRGANREKSELSCSTRTKG